MEESLKVHAAFNSSIKHVKCVYPGHPDQLIVVNSYLKMPFSKQEQKQLDGMLGIGSRSHKL